MSSERHSESCSEDDYSTFKKECPGYDYLPTILPAADKVVAIGDIHGDYQLMIDTLRLAEVIDSKNKWSGGNTIVVQIGDQVDRCRPTDKKCDQEGVTVNDEGSDIKIMEFLTELHKEALPTGGAVYSLLGNHEIMNVVGHLGYVSLEGLKQFDDYVAPESPDRKFTSGKEARKYAFSAGKQYARFMGCTRMAALIIGSNLFAHAGLLPAYARRLDIGNRYDLEKLNKMVRMWLLGRVNQEYVSDIVSSSKNSMFWNRILGSLPSNINEGDPRCLEYLKPSLELLHIDNMIIGHTPQFYANKLGMNATCGDHLWRVDNGASQAFEKFDPLSPKGDTSHQRSPQALIILNDKEFEVIYQDQNKKIIKKTIKNKLVREKLVPKTVPAGELAVAGQEGLVDPEMEVTLKDVQIGEISIKASPKAPSKKSENQKSKKKSVDVGSKKIIDDGSMVVIDSLPGIDLLDSPN